MSDLLTISRSSDHVDVEEARLPYKHLRTLGIGGCSTVEEVEDVNTGDIYARKVFIPKRRNRARIKEIFENELKIIRSLEHHHMVKIFATYTTKVRLAILLTPVADEDDLDSYLEKLIHYQQQPELHAERIDIMTDVLKQSFGCLAAGLAYMHKSRVRHKDIKTHNILIHQNRVLYTDFGISIDTSMFDNSMSEGPTEATRRYAAPEVLQGKPRNSSSDVYSLACVFVEMYKAIDASPDRDEHLSYPDAIEAIHQDVTARHRVLDAYFLRDVMWHMAKTEPSARLTAEEVWRECAKRNDFQCPHCRQTYATMRTNLMENSPTRSPVYKPTSETGQILTDSTNEDPVAAKAEGQRQGSAPNRPIYTPWTWSPAHQRHYSYILDADGSTMLDTLWSEHYPDTGASKPLTAVDTEYQFYPGNEATKPFTAVDRQYQVYLGKAEGDHENDSSQPKRSFHSRATGTTFPPDDGVTTCELCDAQFTGRYQRGNCARHVRQEHVRNSAQQASGCVCRICKKSFTRLDACRKHEWRKHSLPDSPPSRRAYESAPQPDSNSLEGKQYLERLETNPPVWPNHQAHVTSNESQFS